MKEVYLKTNKTREELIKMYIDTLSEGEIPWRKRWINDSNINGITKKEQRKALHKESFFCITKSKCIF